MSERERPSNDEAASTVCALSHFRCFRSETSHGLTDCHRLALHFGSNTRVFSRAFVALRRSTAAHTNKNRHSPVTRYLDACYGSIEWRHHGACDTGQISIVSVRPGLQSNQQCSKETQLATRMQCKRVAKFLQRANPAFSLLEAVLLRSTPLSASVAQEWPTKSSSSW